MPPSSLYTWLKSVFHGNDAKLILENTSKPPTLTAVIVEQEVDDKLLSVATASARISSIATRGVQDVIKAQAGASTTSIKAFRMAKLLSDCTKIPIMYATDVERRARDVVKNTAQPTQVELPVVTDLKIIAARISGWAHKCDEYARDAVDSLNRAEGKYTQNSRCFKMTVAATLTGAAEAACTVSKIVEDHVAAIAHSKKPVSFIEALLFAIHIASTQAAFAAAEAVTVRDPERPPPYEGKSSYEEAEDNEYSELLLEYVGTPQLKSQFRNVLK